MASKPLLLIGISGVVLTASLVAQAQSPFAKRGAQAWEQAPPAQPAPQAAQPAAPQSYPQSYSQPYAAPQTYQQTTTYNAPVQTYSAPPQTGAASANGYYQSQPTYTANSAQTYSAQPGMSSGADYGLAGAPTAATGTYQLPPSQMTVQSGQMSGQITGGYGVPLPSNIEAAGVIAQSTTTTYPAYVGQPMPQAGMPYGGTSLPTTPRQPTWQERYGFGRFVHKISGFFKGGVAATYTDEDGTGDDNWRADFIADGGLSGEMGAVTMSGLEYGIGLEGRVQYDKYRRGFGGLVGDCNPAVPGCSGEVIDGANVALRGHTSRFYGYGPSDAKDIEYQLEGAYVYLRSAYGDVSIGRDDGSAYLFSLGAPTLLAVGASNNSVDYTGLDSVKTINDASGFAEKITYTTPRLLGDQIGFGVQFGASYAPDARACGVDYCVRKPSKEPAGVIAPDLENVAEFGMAIDRTFRNGLEMEATVTYAAASEKRDVEGLDDLSALGLGLEMGYNNWTMGGSYLKSNNALADGDYTSWDIGMTWQPSQWGFTAGFGQAKDKNVGLKSNQAVLGMSYDFNDRFRFGSGVQYIDRDVKVSTGNFVTNRGETATALFIEGRVTF